ncbi:protein-glutamine gamma-glutamyltransferase [Peribacillus alkalitolerans]|uniref:protein-glutamine gamma-glutamyltransferase n=1 Tax=Peribacillus alkalitolerans TaxID=1550385 RepID=UPI0013D5D941|nr:protein-glutamine gamma-glutamyltransferase [Peribacillus alkalitolerans]
MIFINGKETDVSQISLERFPPEAYDILHLMAKNNKRYEFQYLWELEWDLAIRLHTVLEATNLYKSAAKFASFSTSKCNEKYWRLTEKGAFELKKGVTPQTGIEDIFINSDKYAFECATAVVIVLYKAVLDTIDTNTFNRNFANLVLYDWQYDPDLVLKDSVGTDYLPGDILYFKNPDYNPETPEWKGENSILLEEGLFYGHGIGIKTEEGMIRVLNRKRKKDAKISAYLTENIIRVDAYNISQLRNVNLYPITKRKYNIFADIIISKVGSKIYLL